MKYQLNIAALGIYSKITNYWTILMYITTCFRRMYTAK